MKYNKKQFEILLQVLQQFAVLIDLSQSNLHTIHFIIYQQFSEGHKHNWLYCCEGGNLKKYFQMTDEDKKNARKFIEIDFKFELYPDNCNDNNIETAMNKAIKLLGIK